MRVGLLAVFAAAFILIVPLASALPASLPSPTAYWKMDGNAIDSSGNGHDGTLQGNTYCTAAGMAGQACGFDGNGDYIDISGLLGSPTSGTISAWANLILPDTFGGAVLTIADAFSLFIDNPGYSTTGAFYDGTTWRYVPLSTYYNYAGAGWHHFVFVIDSASHVQKIYVDGVMKGATAHSGQPTYAPPGAPLSTKIGSHISTSTFDFNGKIDDVVFWNTPLTDQQVLEIYNSYKPTSDSVSSGTFSAGDSATIRMNFTSPLGNGVTAYACKTDAFTTSCTGGEWCHASNSTFNQSACTYSTKISDIGSNDYYTFVCDGNGLCSPSSRHGVFSVSSNLPQTGNIVAYWKMDGNALDSSGNSGDGTLAGDAYCTASGISGQACSFDGSGDYISLNKIMDSPTSLSFSMWAYPRGNGMFLYHGDGAQFQVAKSPWTSNIVFYVNHGSWAGIEEPAVNNQWYHVAGVWKQGDYLKLYINGVPYTLDITGSGGINTAPGYQSSFGAFAASSQFFDGKLDDVAVWNSALTGQQVQDVYNSYKPTSDYASSNAVEVGSDVTLKMNFTSPLGNGVTAYACKTDAFTTSCTGGEWCHASNSTFNQSACGYTTTQAGTFDYYSFTCDGVTGFCSPSSFHSQFTASEPAPPEQPPAAPSSGSTPGFDASLATVLFAAVLIGILPHMKKLTLKF